LEKPIFLAIYFVFALTLSAPTFVQAESTKTFLKNANQTLLTEQITAQRAEWVQTNFITQDTTILASDANAHYTEIATDYALKSKKFKGSTKDEKRQLNLLLAFLNLPAPKEKAKNLEMTRLKSEMESTYGSGKFCNAKGACKTLQDLESVLAQSRKPAELIEAWEGWRTVSVPMKPKYQRVIELSNQGARELGFKNVADFWKSKYDMPSAAFEKDLDRLWGEVKPFYEQLHCYVRSQLNKKYGDTVAPKEGAIPAHLLGNMWAQSWGNIRDIVGVDASKTTDITQLLKAAKYDSKKMVSTAENFFVSLGMPNLPASFYERSLFEKPRDREVVCHASAWDIDLKDDVRIKMCIIPDDDSFRTIHHELGHIYYYLAYKHQPILYNGSANDGFHEALGDTIQLSITNKYLHEIGLLKKAPKANNENIDYLMTMALEKVAFLPFGLLIDKWRWKVFDGTVKPEQYNQAWWNFVKEYQGVIPPAQRPPESFDPGAKYHVPSFVPYSRYFLAHILQFQFHRSLCQTAGYTGPLHECSIYGSKKAGEKLWKMMELGLSEPWPVALEAVTGQKQMDATALREYFSPLEKWLREKNQGQKCGW
jgi:peptidyl-dipeptidase A